MCSNEMLLLVSDFFRHSECKNHSSLISLRRKRNMSSPESTEPFYFCSLNCYLMFSSCVYIFYDATMDSLSCCIWNLCFLYQLLRLNDYLKMRGKEDLDCFFFNPVYEISYRKITSGA
jgi:hypothetical protein